MVMHSVIIALLAAAPAASPERAPAPENSGAVRADAPQRTAQQLRDAVRAAMRQQATAKGAQQEAAVRELAAVYREVTASTALRPRAQRELRTLVRSRLMRASKALERQLSRAKAAGQKPADRIADGEPPDKPAILAQVGGIAAGGPAGAAVGRPGAAGGQFGPGAQIIGGAASLNAQTNRNAQQLIDLIQNTIAPASWDVNGGLGTIMYFGPGQVLVIRQTGGIHGRVGQAIQGLRGN